MRFFCIKNYQNRSRELGEISDLVIFYYYNYIFEKSGFGKLLKSDVEKDNKNIHT